MHHALVVSLIGFFGSWAIVLGQSCLVNSINIIIFGYGLFKWRVSIKRMNAIQKIKYLRFIFLVSV